MSGEARGEDMEPTGRTDPTAPLSAPSVRQIVSAAIVVAVAYFAGANLGALLRFPPATPSVLWPPNSILTATLLLAPTRRWWVYLLAALPAHLAMPAPPDWRESLILVLYLTNCSEALIAAGSVRAFAGEPTRFDTLRRMGVFLVGAGLFAPFASCFFDAAAVSLLHGDAYWEVWRTRFFSNVLTEMTLVPAVVLVIANAREWITGAGVRAKIEAALLALSLVVVGGLYAFGPRAIPGAPVSSVALFLPVLLWAAVRFGPAGASLSLLATALIAICGGMHARGLIGKMPPADGVLAVQISLSLCAVPLLGLASLIEERRRDQQDLTRRLTFEKWLSELSGAFVHLASDQMDEAFETWLGRLGQLLALDRAALLRSCQSGGPFIVAYTWAAPGIGPIPRASVSADYPWTVERLRREEPSIVSEAVDAPVEAGADAASLRRLGARSMLALPLVAGGRVLGALALVTVRTHLVWTAERVGRLQLVAEVFANALARKESEVALRAGEAMKSAILSSLHSSVGVLDRDGLVIATNPDWCQFPPHHAVPEGLGANYLDACRQMAREGIPLVAQAVPGIASVLDGSRVTYSLEYSCGTPAGERWYVMTVVPLHRPEGGAVVSHADVTERRRAELEAQRSRQELAHVTRVSAMGELTASLAHELNQPLAGTLTNAQAARRFLEMTPPDVRELRSILVDIVEDDKRAADVIQRLRDLLRKGEFQMRRVDLNGLIRDVVKLLGSDTVIRNVLVALDLEERRPTIVSGDRVQLQQVVLNLVLNAMDAMADSPVADRNLLVRTEHSDPESVEVLVEDTGPGLDKDAEALVFEPFYTTKSTGMGMGLAIARSIIEAQDGAIWVEGKRSRGAAFRFRLPLAEEPVE